LEFLFGENWTPPEKYYRARFYPAGGLYTTVSDLSHFLIAHMNDGVYNGTRILKKETVALMHATQPGNQIGYGLGWWSANINDMYLTGHDGLIPGCNTWMYYNQTENIGVIFFANGSPQYALLPYQGSYLLGGILNLLYTKEGIIRGEIQHDFTISSDHSFLMPMIGS
jgi:CubicO group peptidase (beta-lactamase class C family)